MHAKLWPVLAALVSVVSVVSCNVDLSPLDDLIDPLSDGGPGPSVNNDNDPTSFTCGNGVCEEGESCLDCIEDCGACSRGCDDGSCASECQTDANCPVGQHCVDLECVPEVG